MRSSLKKKKKKSRNRIQLSPHRALIFSKLDVELFTGVKMN